MRKSVIFFILFVSFAFPNFAFSQEDVLMETETQGQNQERILKEDIEVKSIKEEKKKKEKKKDKKEKVKKRDRTPSLIVEHKKDKVERYFKVGETIKYQTKKGKHKIRGVLEEIQNDKVIIDGEEIKVSELILLGKSFGRTLGWRTAGVSKFAVGTGVAVAGAALLLFSANQFSIDNSNVVWGVLGAVAGVGVSFVGIHLMVKGGKGVFQSSNKKQKKGWIFKVKM